MAQAKTGKKKIKLAERRAMAADLRKAGHTFEQIARLIGQTLDIRYSVSMAYRDVTHVLNEVIEKSTETAEQILALELMRLDELTRAWWSAAVGKPPTNALEIAQTVEHLRAWLDQEEHKKDKDAAAIILRVMERRAKLMGLDKDNVNLYTPQPLAVTTADLSNINEGELDRIIANLQAAIGLSTDREGQKKTAASK